MDNIRVMPTGNPSTRNKRYLLYHLLVHPHLRKKVGTIVKFSYINLFNLKESWRKRVVILLPALSVVETT